MPRKYVWFDDARNEGRRRCEVWMPETIWGFLRDVSKKNGVSRSSFVVALLRHAFDEEEARRLQVVVEPSKTKIAVRTSAPAPLAQPPPLEPNPWPMIRAKHRSKKP